MIEQKNFKLSSGFKYIIRTASQEDAVRILDYVKEVLSDSEYLVTAPEEFKRTVNEEMEWIHTVNDLEHDLLIMALIDSEVIGLLNYSSRYRRRIIHAGTLGMTVAKKFRGMGVGKALLETLLEWAEKNPVIKKVMLEVVAENIPAVNLYKKLGFIEEGRKVEDILLDKGQYADVLMMYKFVKQ